MCFLRRWEKRNSIQKKVNMFPQTFEYEIFDPMTWMMSGEKTFTPGGQLRAASLVTVCQWVKESWQELSKEMVERSFKKCGISNALDGTEDDLVWEEEEDSSQVEEEPDCDV